MRIEDIIVEKINDPQYQVVTIDQFLEQLKVDKHTKEDTLKLIYKLNDRHQLRITKKNKVLPVTKEEKALMGTIIGNKKGFAFFKSEDPDVDDIFIAHKNLSGAFHNDYVQIEIKDKNADRLEARVVKILSRNSQPIVATLYKNKKFSFAIADDDKYFDDFYIDNSNTLNAKDKDKVVVKIIDYPKNQNPEAKVIKVIGNKDQRYVDIYSIADKYKINYNFSNRAKKEASFIDKAVSKKFIKERKDFRELFTVTIDGKDSKDFDDAISIEKLDHGYRLFVHIADVAHYVKENTAIDKEAYEKGNSTYLYDVVIPMLPKELSNGICSLNPNVDRLTITVMMDFDKQANLIDHNFYKSVIKSDYRLTYEDVNRYLHKKEKVFEDDVLEEHLILFNDLSKKLHQKRKQRGSVDLKTIESKIEIDSSGKVIDVKENIRRDANKLIEEFMLACNECVSELFYYMDIPFIYRVHEVPEKLKVEELNRILHLFHLNIKGETLFSKDFQKILESVKGLPHENLINNLILRTMQKALYSDINLGHFGLCAKYYTHFTSPIRRYSDLIAHRLLKSFLDNRIENLNMVKLQKYLEKSTQHLSETERISEACEREVEALEKCKYMKEKIGESFTGIITSITDFGIFIMLENTIEGLFMYKFSKDNYIFNPLKVEVRNTDIKKLYRIGDRVDITVGHVDMVKYKIDFILEQ